MKFIVQLKNITFEQAQTVILPEDVFLEKDTEDYKKGRHYLKDGIYTFSVLMFLGCAVVALVSLKVNVFTRVLPYIFLIFTIGLLSMMVKTYWIFIRDDRNVKEKFYKKKYKLVKSLSTYFILFGFWIFSLYDSFIINSRIGNFFGNAISALLLLLLYLILSFIILRSKFSSEVGKFEVGFQKTWLQRVVDRVFSVIIGGAVIFYILYKIIWVAFPNLVHAAGDSLIGVYALIMGIAILFTTLPAYTMSEKMVKGYLVNKYYDQFNEAYDFEEAIFGVWKVQDSEGENSAITFGDEKVIVDGQTYDYIRSTIGFKNNMNFYEIKQGGRNYTIIFPEEDKSKSLMIEPNSVDDVLNGTLLYAMSKVVQPDYQTYLTKYFAP